MKFDVGDSKVEEFCLKNHIPVLMKIPNDRNIAVAYSKGIPITETVSKYKKEFIEVYKKIYERADCNKR